MFNIVKRKPYCVITLSDKQFIKGIVKVMWTAVMCDYEYCPLLDQPLELHRHEIKENGVNNP